MIDVDEGRTISLWWNDLSVLIETRWVLSSLAMNRFGMVGKSQNAIGMSWNCKHTCEAGDESDEDKLGMHDWIVSVELKEERGSSVEVALTFNRSVSPCPLSRWLCLRLYLGWF